MVRLDTPPDAIDHTYAASLFGLAEDRGGRDLLESLAGEAQEIVDLLRDQPQLEEFIASRIIRSEAKQESLIRIFRGNIDELILDLLLVMNRKERGNRFVRALAAFDHMVEERFGRVEVDVYTRYPVPADQLDGIKRALQERLGREPIVYTYVDEAMIGGIRVRVGDRLLDASYATQLRKMREMLKDEGAAILRERADRAILND